MNWAELIVSILKIVSILLSHWKEKNDEKRKQKEAILKEATKAFAKKDVSSINLAFDKLRNLNR